MDIEVEKLELIRAITLLQDEELIKRLRAIVLQTDRPAEAEPNKLRAADFERFDDWNEALGTDGLSEEDIAFRRKIWQAERPENLALAMTRQEFTERMAAWQRERSAN